LQAKFVTVDSPKALSRRVILYRGETGFASHAWPAPQSPDRPRTHCGSAAVAKRHTGQPAGKEL